MAKDWFSRNLTIDRILLIAILIFQLGKFVSMSSLSTTDLQAQVNANQTELKSHESYADQTFARKDILNQVVQRLEQEINDKLDYLIQEQRNK